MDGCFCLRPMKKIFLLLLVAGARFFAGELAMIAVESATDPSDVQALRDLLRAVDPATVLPGSCLASWDFSADPCDAVSGSRFTCGIRCDLNASSSSGYVRVTELSLDPAGYSGALSLSPGSLPLLRDLYVADNRFYGPIPPAISTLSGLLRLSLARNSFSGQIPLSFVESLPSLQELYLDGNQIGGTLPPAFGSGMRSLFRLELQSNQISGELPDFSRLSSLAYFDASSNRLFGRIDSSRFPPSTVEVSLRSNLLDGSLQEDFGRNLPLLQVMDLSNNSLSGSVPPALFQHPSLEQLTLSYNGFSAIGGFPAVYGGGSVLIALDLGHNRMEGPVPAFLAQMPSLAALSLESNRLTGTIPAEYAAKLVGSGGVQPFARLMLSGNYLSGAIPRPLIRMAPGSVTVSLADNCLLRCPHAFFFCQGGDQKSVDDCRRFCPPIR